MEDIYEKVMELAKRRGFVWPSSECYGSVAGLIDYGPLGAGMKRRIENIWREFYVIREGFFEIECPTIGPEPVFIASGHVGGFSDKMCRCPACGEYHRADHIVEGCLEGSAALMQKEDLEEVLRDLPCPACGEKFGSTTVFDFNLMFETAIGPGSQRKGYLRPETAQGIFTDFGRLLRFYRDKLPFGVVQIGKSYRNEISPRQGMIRLREFSQAEAEIFVHPEKKQHPRFSRYAGYTLPLLGITQQEDGELPLEITMADAVASGLVANEYVAYYLALTHDLFLSIGITPEKLRFRQHMPDERAHYAIDCWDAEVHSDRFGWVETVGIADRTDYDLRAHARHSGESFTVFIQFPEPRRVKQVRISPKMGIMGPKFRGKAKAISEMLKTASPGPDGVEITLEGETILITPDLYDVCEEEVEIRGVEVMPHVIEPSYGIDRMIYGVLEHTYAEEMVEGEVRKVLRLPTAVAPVQVSVLPLMNRDGLEDTAREIYQTLLSHMIYAIYDDSGAIGRRYRRQDEIGTPFAVTTDYDTLEDGTVTIRDRDSMEQVRCPADHLVATLSALISGSITFESLQA